MQEFVHDVMLKPTPMQSTKSEIQQTTVFNDGCVVANCMQCGELVEALDPSRCFYCMAIMCWTCWGMTYGSCKGCIKDLERERVRIAAQLAEGEPKPRNGRPKKLSACEYCGCRLGVRVMRRHKPICAKLTPEERMA